MRSGEGRYWNPYLAGAITGLVMVLSVVVSAKYFGASTSFVRTVGLIERVVSPEHVAQTAYFVKKAPKIDWQWMFLVGIFLGSLIASLISRTWKSQTVPDMWRGHLGRSIWLRAVVAFGGGAIMIFGARFAGGCPSGHGLSGIMQLAPSGLISTICFFIGGIIVAKLVYRKGVRS
jgi:uncharacterized membrane protein YedE/YeeE